MTVHELLEQLEEKRRLYPCIDDYTLATLALTVQDHNYAFSLQNKVTIDHTTAIVVIEPL